MTERGKSFYLSYGCYPEDFNKYKLYNTRYLTPERDYSASMDICWFKEYPKYCPYCGHKMKLYTSKDGKEKFFNCDCSDALNEYIIAGQIEKLYDQMPRPKYRMTSDGSVLPLKLYKL